MNGIKHMKISTKILVLVTIICSFALLSISTAAYITVKKITSYSLENNEEIGNNVASGAEKAILDQTRHFLQIIASEQARSCSNALQDIQSNVLMIEGVMRDIFNHPENYQKSREIVNIRDVTPGIYSNTWMLPSYVEMTPETEREIALMSNLEIIMQPLAANPGLMELYAGLESGLLYSFTSIRFDDLGYDPRTRPWYIEALKHPDEVIFLDVYEDAFGKGKVITCAKTVFDGSGKLIGVACVDIQLDLLTEIILETQIMESGYAFILDRTGRYVVHPDMGKEGFQEYPLKTGGTVAFEDGYRHMVNGEDGFVSEEIDGEVYYLTFSHMSVADWSVGVVASEDDILSSLKSLTSKITVWAAESEENIIHMSNRAILVFAAIFLIVCIMVFILVVSISSFISRPIQKLTREIEKIDEDNLKYEIPIESHDEIGILTEAFNKMTADLYEYTLNILELNHTKSKLEVAANTDVLTGIFNRRHFMSFASVHLERASKSNSAAFIMLFDIDYFKEVNDTYGHLAGDEVLKAIAVRAKNMIRPGDLFARYGGEEFILLVTEVNETIARNLADRIRLSISQTPIEFEDMYISVTSSFGIAQAVPVNDLEAAIKLADEALYKAKNEGRNKTVLYEPK